MVCMFYEPAYVAVDQWFDGLKGRLTGVLTVVAWVSAMVFVPLTPSSAANSIAFLILYLPLWQGQQRRDVPSMGLSALHPPKGGFQPTKSKGVVRA
jgi:hypothetical protein